MLGTRPAGLPLDIERGISTKTPGRVLSKTRNILQENANRNIPMTVIGKTRKLVQNTPLQSRTLHRVLKDPPGKRVGPSKLKDTPAVRPLGDKTPFPNRIANQPLASGAKITKPPLDGSFRPSSARKHDNLPRSASKLFETPITDGNHWDVSDIEIELNLPVENQSIQEESSDEIEYMPPKLEDVPYEPPFEMPNYREVGKTFMALIRSYTMEDDPPSNNLTFNIDPSEKNFFAQPTLPRPEIEDDSPFARVKPDLEAKPRPTTLKQRSTAYTKPTQRLAGQRTTSTTRTTTTTNSRIPPTTRRPPPSSSTRPSTTATRTSVSQPVTRAATSQSTSRAPISRATTRVPSVARSAPLMRTDVAQPCRTTPLSRPTTKSAVRSTSSAIAVQGKMATRRPSTAPSLRHPAPGTDVSPYTGRPRSGTITKEAFESNSHVAIHIRNNSLEEVKKDLEGLIVFEDDSDEDEFRFDV